MTRPYAFVTVDVFTRTRFGGNQLAVFPDARGLTDAQMQALAAEMNLSETTFVLPPSDPAHTARVRIFNRAQEMPFAGHPNVGTAFVLARAGRATPFVFEETAGLVAVEILRDAQGTVTGAEIAAPQPLTLGARPDPAAIAACAGLTAADILLTGHAPVMASVGVDFLLAEVTPEALTRATPDIAAFRALRDSLPDIGDRLSLHLYARTEPRLRARMFAPLSGTWEDPATGSANATLGALLLSLGTGDAQTFEIDQGHEMGRPSQLRVTARRGPDGINARVGGDCVPVLRGQAEV